MIADADCRDMLVKLYDLPASEGGGEALAAAGVEVRRALTPEKSAVLAWIRENHANWVDECAFAFRGHPIPCFIAVGNNRVAGVCIYDSIARGVLGPLAASADFAAQRVGQFLLLETLRDMRRQGYAYAVIGWCTPSLMAYYRRVAKAEVIEGSEPQLGIYRGMIRRDGG